MAARDPEEFAARSGQDASDPFAELARIIGFDPRQRVIENEINDVPASSQAAEQDDDFAELNYPEPTTGVAVADEAAASSDLDRSAPDGEDQDWDLVLDDFDLTSDEQGTSAADVVDPPLALSVSHAESASSGLHGPEIDRDLLEAAAPSPQSQPVLTGGADTGSADFDESAWEEALDAAFNPMESDDEPKSAAASAETLHDDLELFDGLSALGDTEDEAGREALTAKSVPASIDDPLDDPLSLDAIDWEAAWDVASDAREDQPPVETLVAPGQDSEPLSIDAVPASKTPDEGIEQAEIVEADAGILEGDAAPDSDEFDSVLAASIEETLQEDLAFDLDIEERDWALMAENEGVLPDNRAIEAPTASDDNSAAREEPAGALEVQAVDESISADSNSELVTFVEAAPDNFSPELGQAPTVEEEDFELALLRELTGDDEDAVVSHHPVKTELPEAIQSGQSTSEDIAALALSEPEIPEPLKPEPAPLIAEANKPELATASVSEDDPFAALAAMAARYRASRSPSPSPVGADASARAQFNTPIEENREPAMKQTMPQRAAAPEIETVYVPEQFSALPDDLDLPETQYEQSPRAQSEYDELDSEFADLLHEMSDGNRTPDTASAQASRWEAWDRHNAATEQQNADHALHERGVGSDRDNSWQAADHDQSGPVLDDQGADDFAEDDEPGNVPEKRAVLRKPGTWLSALIGIAVLGGGAAIFALGTNSPTTGEPVLVKADASPLKMKPANPGGTVVPNQTSRVYERVAGQEAPTPVQGNLLPSAEEPIDLAAASEDEPLTDGLDFVGGDPDVEELIKGEERIVEEVVELEPAQSERLAVTPVKVRTMVVKADGTLVPREEEVAAAVVQPAVDAAQEALRQVQERSVGSAQVEAGEQTGSITPTVVEPSAADPAAKPVRLASLSAGEWSIQIASQPSEQAAQSSYDDLAKRYSGVLAGRGVNIVKAEVSGKGTFWRVRIPAGTRDDAVSLCTNLKSAGGSCFVSK